MIAWQKPNRAALRREAVSALVTVAHALFILALLASLALTGA